MDRGGLNFLLTYEVFVSFREFGLSIFIFIFILLGVDVYNKVKIEGLFESFQSFLINKLQ